MEKCFISLFENAIQMLPENGQIVVTTKYDHKNSTVHINVLAQSEEYSSEHNSLSFDSSFSFNISHKYSGRNNSKN